MAHTTDASPWQRYTVIGALFVLSLITYIDRAAISSAKGPMARDLSLSDTQMGMVFSVFALGYALAQIPAGWLADRYGPRLALAGFVTVWSLLTALTGAMSMLGPLLFVRFAFGTAEAGAFPGAARVFYNWLPPGERGIANGILFSGGLIGGAVAFPFYAWLVTNYSWRGAFYLLALPGLVWAACWLIWFRDVPGDRRQPRAPAVQPPLDMKAVLRVPGIWPAMFQYFAGNFTFYICISWMYPYLIERYGLSSAAAAQYAMIPLLCGATANWCAGFLVDGLYRSSYRGWSRQLPGVLGFCLATCGVLMVAVSDSALSAIVGFAVATFGVEMTISPSWAYCLDVGGTRAATVSGTMNTAGNLGGFVSMNAFPWLMALTGTATTYFLVAAVFNVLAILCWRVMSSPIVEPAPLPAQTSVVAGGTS
jgi:ACS family glucarate transporter-like MFS transporter